MFELSSIIEPVVVAIELSGFTVIVLGMLGTTAHTLHASARGDLAWKDAYFKVRRGNGRSLVLGLELLVAAEIIRSIAAETLEAVAMLAAVVLIRTFLAITVEMETEGQWPWDRDNRWGGDDPAADSPKDGER